VSHSHCVYSAVFTKLFALGAWQQIEIYVRKASAKSCATSANCMCPNASVCVCVCCMVTIVVWEYGKWQMGFMGSGLKQQKPAKFKKLSSLQH